MPVAAVTSGNPFTYRFYDWLSGDFLGTLPLAGVTFSKKLNTPGTFTGKLNLLDQKIQALDPYSMILPGRTIVVVDLAGSAVWGGPLWSDPYDQAQANATPVNASEAWSYFAQRVQAQDYTNPPAGAHWNTNPADPLKIAAQIVADAIAPTTSGFGTATGFPLTIAVNGATPSDAWVSQSYPMTQVQTIDTIVTQLAQMGYGQGFDFGIDVAYNTDLVPTFTLNLDYPVRGHQVDPDSLAILRAMAYTYPRDATLMADIVFETGGGAATAPTEAFNLPALEAGYPILERVISYSNVTAPAVLEGLAQSDIGLYGWPVATPTLTIPAVGSPTLTDYTVGDVVRWVIPPDERFPAGLDWYWRITGIDVTVPDDGIATAMLTLNVPVGSGAGAPPA